jgi:small neutral amino acid transporter SnatA (MarC family)
VAIFAGLTASLTRAERCRTALRATVYAAVILVVAVMAGQIILDAIGIHLHSLKVAGGIILSLFGLQMLFGRMDAEAETPEPGRDLAVFPLAVPSIAGPGAMMAVILLTDNDVTRWPSKPKPALSCSSCSCSPIFCCFFPMPSCGSSAIRARPFLSVSWGSFFAHSRWKSC